MAGGAAFFDLDRTLLRGASGPLISEALSAAALVPPYAPALVAEHKRAGRPVVLATTTPHDLVSPLAERLGFDDVVATRYAEAGGSYTGALEGEFVWANGKLAAVRRWAAGHDIDMSRSYAYSDSVYDLPLL